MIGISDVELAPRKGIRTRYHQFAWSVVLYDCGSEIALHPLIVTLTTRDSMAVLNSTIKEAMEYAMDISPTNRPNCSYTFTVLSDREFMMVETICNYDFAVYLYRLMGEMEMKVKPEVL